MRYLLALTLALALLSAVTPAKADTTVSLTVARPHLVRTYACYQPAPAMTTSVILVARPQVYYVRPQVLPQVVVVPHATCSATCATPATLYRPVVFPRFYSWYHGYDYGCPTPAPNVVSGKLVAVPQDAPLPQVQEVSPK